MRSTLPSRKWNNMTIINKRSNAFLIGFQTSTRDLLRNQLQFEWASSDACISYNISQAAWGMRRMAITESHICPGRHCVTARLTAPQCFFAAGLASMNQWHQLQHVYRRRPRNWLWHLISGYLKYLKPFWQKKTTFQWEAALVGLALRGVQNGSKALSLCNQRKFSWETLQYTNGIAE